MTLEFVLAFMDFLYYLFFGSAGVYFAITCWFSFTAHGIKKFYSRENENKSLWREFWVSPRGWWRIAAKAKYNHIGGRKLKIASYIAIISSLFIMLTVGLGIALILGLFAVAINWRGLTGMSMSNETLPAIAAISVFVVAGCYVISLYLFLAELKNHHAQAWIGLGRPKLIDTAFKYARLYWFLLLLRYRALPGKRIITLGHSTNGILLFFMLYVALISAIFSGKTVWVGPFPITFYSTFW